MPVWKQAGVSGVFYRRKINFGSGIAQFLTGTKNGTENVSEFVSGLSFTFFQ